MLIFGGKDSSSTDVCYFFSQYSILCPDCAAPASSKSNPQNSFFIWYVLRKASKSLIIFDVHVNYLHFGATCYEDITNKSELTEKQSERTKRVFMQALVFGFYSTFPDWPPFTILKRSRQYSLLFLRISI